MMVTTGHLPCFASRLHESPLSQQGGDHVICLWKMLASLAFGAICLSTILAQTERGDDRHVQTMLALRDASSHAQYRALEREAQAVFRAAITHCRKLQAPEFANCTQDAKTHLHDELSEAKRVTGTGL